MTGAGDGFRSGLGRDAGAGVRVIGAGIAAHLTVGVADDLGDLGFVSAGAAVDVIGDRLWDLDRSWVDELLARHPRLEFKRHMIAALTEEATNIPGGRVKWMNTTAGFRQLIRMAPFAE